MSDSNTRSAGVAILKLRTFGHIKKYICFPSVHRLIEKPADSKVFIWISDRSFSISGISFPSSLFPFLHFTITESFCWYVCKHVFRLLLVETMASYEKRPRMDIKQFTVYSNVVIKCGTEGKTYIFSNVALYLKGHNKVQSNITPVLGEEFFSLKIQFGIRRYLY